MLVRLRPANLVLFVVLFLSAAVQPSRASASSPNRYSRRIGHIDERLCYPGECNGHSAHLHLRDGAHLDDGDTGGHGDDDKPVHSDHDVHCLGDADDIHGDRHAQRHDADILTLVDNHASHDRAWHPREQRPHPAHGDHPGDLGQPANADSCPRSRPVAE